MAKKPMTMTRRDQLNQRLGALKLERSSFIDHWRELSEFILPRQARFFVTDRNRGDRRSGRINDNTATLAVRTLASGMMGGLTSPSRPWFNLRTRVAALNELQPVKLWLATVRDLMNEVFLASNLYTTLPLTYSDLGVFGTNAFAVLEDDEDVIRCYSFPVGSYMIGTDHRGKVDTFYYECQKTVGQIVDQFGIENCSTAVKSQYERRSLDTWITVYQAVEPNPDFDAKKLDSKFKAWRSIYWEQGQQEDKFLSEKGFDDFPIMAPRWQLAGEDIYGHSPGMEALGDIKTLQLEQKRKMEAISKQVNPPMNAPVSMQNAAASVLPGAINYVDASTGQQGFTPAYQVQARLDHLLADIQENQQRIKRAFYEDLFLMLANIQHGQMTAQEVAERQEEKLLLLGPVLERLNDELFDPLIDRVFKIMIKRNLLPPPPPELNGQDLNVEYVSIMAQAQKLQGIGGVQQLMAFTGNLAAAHPEVLDKIDFDATVDSMGSMLGVPPQLVRDAKGTDAIRQQRAKQQQAAQTMAMAAQGAQTAQVLANTNVTSPSALTAIQAQMQGRP